MDAIPRRHVKLPKADFLEVQHGLVHGGEMVAEWLGGEDVPLQSQLPHRGQLFVVLQVLDHGPLVSLDVHLQDVQCTLWTDRDQR